MNNEDEPTTSSSPDAGSGVPSNPGSSSPAADPTPALDSAPHGDRSAGSPSTGAPVGAGKKSSPFNLVMIIGGVSALLAIVFFILLGREGGGGSLFPGQQTLSDLDFDIPIHFTSYDLEKEFPSSKAISRPGVINRVEGGSISIQAHSDNKNAQLRVIRLPKSLHATEEAARILAESGAVQECDILLTFRPEWWKFNAYCNLQLGVSHSAMATIDDEGGKKYVHTIEAPLNYSSRLNYPAHYRGFEVFHIVRPHLSSSQKKNVADWSRRILKLPNQDLIPFYQDYGLPYQFRKHKAPATGNLPLDLAKVVLYSPKDLKVPVYCSELLWAILALRDVDPDEVTKNFPAQGNQDPGDWIKQRINPVFDPLPGFTDNPLSVAGLMQGPDIQLRALMGNDDAQRRQYLLDKVLLTKPLNPAGTEGNLSPGHAMAAEVFRVMKLPQLRSFYGVQQEDPSYLPALNQKIAPNYSPTAYMFLANLPNATRQFSYVATVSFLPAKQPSPTPTPATPQ